MKMFKLINFLFPQPPPPPPPPFLPTHTKNRKKELTSAMHALVAEFADPVGDVLQRFAVKVVIGIDVVAAVVVITAAIVIIVVAVVANTVASDGEVNVRAGHGAIALQTGCWRVRQLGICRTGTIVLEI